MSDHNYVSPQVREGAASIRTEQQARAFLSAAARVAHLPRVYSFYLAYRAQKGMQGPDPENIIARVGDVETVGDCRHAITVTDFNGTKYRVTVEVMP